MNAKIDVTGVKLESERLILRPWSFADLDDFYEYASVPGVGERAGWPHHKSKEESLEILKHFIDGKRTFAICYDNKVIGSLGLHEYNEKALPDFSLGKGREIGYALSKDYWGRGIMTEAVRKVIDYCFNDLHFDFLVCGASTENKQSLRVQEKCGFKYCKTIVYKTQLGEEKLTYLNILMNINI